jgi:hypothetical protein
MSDHDDMTSRILASLAALPLHAHAEAILGMIDYALKQMTVFRILEIREEIATELDADIPLVQAALELIEGQLALRRISGRAGWR